MCRFIAYLGKPIIPAELLVKPKNSLIKQSIHALELPTHPLNGDGFGLAWYNHRIDHKPALFKSVKPAWNDINLTQLAGKIEAKCFFAHVRAASKGGVGLANTHPFKHEDLLFMHNGDIGDFAKIKRHLRRQLNDDIYDWIKGQTDSEHFFALFLETYYQQHKTFTLDAVTKTLTETLKKLIALRKEYQAIEPAFLNIVLTDGKSAVAMRYVSDESLNARTLYYATGSHYECKDEISQMHAPKIDKNEAVLIVSEKLNKHKGEWMEIPKNHFLCVDEHLQVKQHQII